MAIEGARILCLIPQTGFDPTEAAVPFSVLSSTEHGAVFTFAVPRTDHTADGSG